MIVFLRNLAQGCDCQQSDLMGKARSKILPPREEAEKGGGRLTHLEGNATEPCPCESTPKPRGAVLPTPATSSLHSPRETGLRDGALQNDLRQGIK